MKTKLNLWWNDDFEFYDLVVQDEKSTITDLEAVCDSVFCGRDVRLKYNESCQWCCICCGGRIPLTPGDIVRLQNSSGLDIDEWWRQYIQVIDLGVCLDFTLVCRDDICVLWDREKLICSHYSARPLVCRSYVCAPFSYRLTKLRSEIVNYGEDLLTDMYRKQEFSGCTDFQETALKNICSPELWKMLIRDC